MATVRILPCCLATRALFSTLPGLPRASAFQWRGLSLVGSGICLLCVSLLEAAVVFDVGGIEHSRENFGVLSLIQGESDGSVLLFWRAVTGQRQGEDIKVLSLITRGMGRTSLVVSRSVRGQGRGGGREKGEGETPSELELRVEKQSSTDREGERLCAEQELAVSAK